jgi:molybdenum storage protein
MFCRLGYLPITYGIPPYGFFEHPAEFGSIPPHRTDCGAFLLAENIGARSLIYLKDEKGLFDRDPKKVGPEERKNLKFYDRISAGELLAADLDDLIIERPILAMLQRAKCIKQLQIIDALHNPGDILRALEGEPVGTIITKG